MWSYLILIMFLCFKLINLRRHALLVKVH